MFRLLATMRRGSSSGMPLVFALYDSIESARAGSAALLREDTVLRVMIVRDEIPQVFVEWSDR